MTRALRIAVAIASLLVATGASAQARFTVAGRIGVATPYGDAFRTSTGATAGVAEAISVAIPFQVDLGVTLARHWFVGAYGQYRLSILKSGVCPEGNSCSETGARIGGEVIYSLATSRSGAGLWFGLGSGWEWSTSRGSFPGTTATVTLSGWEYARFQVGADLWLTTAAKVGFYLSGSVGEFSQASVSDGSGSAATTIGDRTLHGWFELGLKSTFEL